MISARVLFRFARFAAVLLVFSVTLFTVALSQEKLRQQNSWPRLTNGIPLVLNANSMFEVSAEFLILEFEQSSNRLRGSLLLQNNSKKPTTFSVFGGFGYHLRLRDADGIEVEVAKRVGWPKPIRRIVNLEAMQCVTNAFDINISDLYDLELGEYYMSFVYDVRLNGPRRPNQSPFVPWSEQGFRVRVLRRTTKY